EGGSAALVARVAALLDETDEDAGRRLLEALEMLLRSMRNRGRPPTVPTPEPPQISEADVPPPSLSADVDLAVVVHPAHVDLAVVVHPAHVDLAVVVHPADVQAMALEIRVLPLLGLADIDPLALVRHCGFSFRWMPGMASH